MTEQAIMRFCQGCNDTVAETEACISNPGSLDAALDMIRWCQYTRKAVSAIQKTSKKEEESLSEKSVNSPVVLGVGSTKSSMDNRLSRIEEYIEKMMSAVTSLVQEQSAKQGTSPNSRSPNQDNRYSDYSPRRHNGSSRGRGNNSGDMRYTRHDYYNNECFNCHQQGHYIKDCPDLYVQDTGQSVHKEPTSQQVSFNENNKDDFYDSEGVVSGISTVRSLGTVKLFRVEVKIAGKKVLALVDSGSEVTILKDTFFDTLEPKPFVIRETTMYGAGTNMTMPCRLTSPIKFKIGDKQFNQQLYVAPVSCDMILGCDFIMHNRVVMNIRELTITVQNRNMPLILGGESTSHIPNVNIVHGPNTSGSSSDEKPSTEGSTQRFDTVIPQVESNLGMMASTSTHESEERGTQEEPDQCRDNKDQCCTNKEESRGNLGFYTCPKSGKRERTCVQSRTDRKCPVKNCPVVVDRRDVKRHCFEEHLSEIFQTYHAKRLMEDRRFHQHRAYVVMLIAKWLTRQETVTAKDLVNFLNEKSFVPRSTHVTGIQMQVHRTVCKEMGWTDYFRYSLRPVNSPACLLNWRVLTSVLHFLTPEQQDMVAEGFNYNPRNPPEPEELAQMNGSFWPVFVDKTQIESAILQKEEKEDNFVSQQEERPIVMDEPEEIHYESENLNVSSTSYSLVENKNKKRKLQSSIENNDTDAHHNLENETAILLGSQVSQLAESQVEPSSSQIKWRQSPQVPTIVVIQYGGLQCMASVSSMTELYNVVTERFPESGNVSLICEGSVLHDSVRFDLLGHRPHIEVAHMVVLLVDTVTVDIAIAITEVIMDSASDITDFPIMEFVNYDNDYPPGAVVVKNTVYGGGYHLGDSHVVTYMDYYKKYHGFKISHSRFTYEGKDYDAGYSPKTVVVKTASYGDDSLY
ncbi:Hypothetical predicted protein [Mytilus galloprovincialis]|uniref:CCHC-type domain-containing protein n=1 Tax=Mytilus galloprovincialis TaxID=29158 RepID=A0A8B6FN15_MYTGA|nr:Hypothetical predicted protein [Mytilus galloprovincialis]